MDRRGYDKNTLACLHTKSEVTFWSIFILVDYLLYLSLVLGSFTYHTLQWEPLPVFHSSFCSGFTAWRKGHGTNTHDFVQKHVTRLVNYPATLCILSDFCCNTRRFNFHRWSPSGETAHNKATQNPTVLEVRPSSFLKTPTHRLARAWDTTVQARSKMWCNVELCIGAWLIN